MSPKEFRLLFGFTVHACAKMAEIEPTTWYRWEYSEFEPKKWGAAKNRIIAAIQKNIEKVDGF